MPDVLGAHVGGDPYCAQYTRSKRLEKVRPLLREVPQLVDAQDAHRLVVHS